MKKIVKVIISEKEIHVRISELGKEITNNYRNSNKKMVLIGLLKGSFIFLADLCRRIKVSHKVDFIMTSSYGNNTISTGTVEIIKDLEENIYNKNVLIIEDIIDSGHTLNKVINLLKLRNPKSIAICTLLDKPECHEVNLNINYVGFYIPNDFIVGYGIDYAQHYRHLPYIGKVVSK